jgi:hypothetical protein
LFIAANASQLSHRFSVSASCWSGKHRQLLPKSDSLLLSG